MEEQLKKFEENLEKAKENNKNIDEIIEFYQAVVELESEV